MLKKIVLPVSLLIFTQQQFYGTDKNIEEKEVGILGTIEELVNFQQVIAYPKLWWLWAIFDNVQFQYGNSKIWKHGEAYYGLSNGIGFFLNFKWFKIGIIDTHINVINFILVGFKYFVGIMYCDSDNYSLWRNILYTLYYNSVITGIHLLSFNFLNCLKIKIISIGIVIVYYTGLAEVDRQSWQWYHICLDGAGDITKTCKDMSFTYLFLSPRIEINISGIINYFNGK